MPINHPQRISSEVLRFDCYEVDLHSGELRKRGIRLTLREQSFRVLAALLERPGEIVSREQLHHLLWHGNVFVDLDNNLNTVVAHLREVLCDSAEHPRFIETQPKHGYRFVAEIHGPVRPSTRNRLLLLPFVNLSGDPNQEYFTDAMTDEVITTLASVAPDQVAVIARTTSMRYKGTRKDVARIGRELDVDYVVEGALRREGDNVTLNVQLVRASDQEHLFAKRYHAKMSDIFEMHKAIAEDVADHMPTAQSTRLGHVPVAGAVERKRATEDLAAYNEYIQGRYLREKLTPESMGAAKQHFEEALRLDPEFALAHMEMASLYTWVGYMGYMRPTDAYSLGAPYAYKAAAFAPLSAEAHAILAEYHKQVDFNWPAARREIAKAVELNSNSPFVRVCNAVVYLMPQNRMKEAVTEIEVALESDPLAATARICLGCILLLAREYDRAIEEARCLLELEPNSPWPHFIEGIACRQKYYDQFVTGVRISVDASMAQVLAERAVAEHWKCVELSPGTDYYLGWLGLALGAVGRKDEARTVLERLRKSGRYNLPSGFAHCHFGVGEIDAAFDWFDKAIDERDQQIMPILSYAHFDPLRPDPRFHALLRKMKLQI